MCSFDEMGNLLDEVVEEMPSENFSALDGGINLSYDSKYKQHSASERDFVLCERIDGAMGCCLNVYYGSFVAAFPTQSVDELKGLLKLSIERKLNQNP